FALDEELHRDIFPALRFLEGDRGAGLVDLREGENMVGTARQDRLHLSPRGRTRGRQVERSAERQGRVRLQPDELAESEALLIFPGLERFHFLLQSPPA